MIPAGLKGGLKYRAYWEYFERPLQSKPRLKLNYRLRRPGACQLRPRNHSRFLAATLLLFDQKYPDYKLGLAYLPKPAGHKSSRPTRSRLEPLAEKGQKQYQRLFYSSKLDKVCFDASKARCF